MPGTPAPGPDSDDQERGCTSNVIHFLGCLLAIAAVVAATLIGGPAAATAVLAALAVTDPGLAAELSPLVLLGPVGVAIAAAVAAVALWANATITIPESENHILQIETSRLLINRLMERDYECTDPVVKDIVCSRDDYLGQSDLFDISADGDAAWMLAYLQRFLMHDFVEFNSRPYQRLSVIPLLNLYDMVCYPEGSPCTGDALRVKIAARAVLDYLSAKFAVSNSSLRRLVPYRRKAAYKGDAYAPSGLYYGGADYETLRFMGSEDPSLLPACPRPDPTPTPQVTPPATPSPTTILVPPVVCLDVVDAGNLEMLTAGVSSYAVPLGIEALIDPVRSAGPTSCASLAPCPAGPFIDSGCRGDLQRYAHDGQEIYYCAPGYLISAGGVSTKAAYFTQGSSKADDIGQAVATTFMPDGLGTQVSDLVRFEGGAGHNAGNLPNVCVARDFACGLGPVLPDSYAALPLGTCRAVSGPWTFIDGTCLSGAGGARGSFFLALYRAECAADAVCQAAGVTEWGFLSVMDARRTTFDAFQLSVAAGDAGATFTLDGPDTYHGPGGGSVTFTPSSAAIVGGSPPGPYLAAGDIVNATGDGCVLITEPSVPDTLVLSLVDLDDPYIIRTAEPGATHDQLCVGARQYQESER